MLNGAPYLYLAESICRHSPWSVIHQSQLSKASLIVIVEHLEGDQPRGNTSVGSALVPPTLHVIKWTSTGCMHIAQLNDPSGQAHRHDVT